MEKKKIITLIAIISFMGVFMLAENGIASTINVHYFNCDKETYFSDETICINASWDLNYNPNPPANEKAFIQIRIMNASDFILWQSAFYYDNGSFLTGEWNVSIKDLDLPSNFTYYLLSVCFYWQDDEVDDYLEIREIHIVKRNLSCELIDFTPDINYHDNLNFKARFIFLENNTCLTNYCISVIFQYDGLILYEKNFTTDNWGIIEINLSVSNNLTVGKVLLLFEIMGNIHFYDSQFEFRLKIYLNEKDSKSSKNTDPENNKTNYSNFLPFLFSILCVSFVAFLFIYHNNYKKSKGHKLADLTFKY